MGVMDKLFAVVQKDERRMIFKAVSEWNGMALLPPKATQKLPTNPGFSEPIVIDAVHFSITPEETAALRETCRDHGATIHGAWTAAALMARAKLLDLSSPVHASVQILVDTHSLLAPSVALRCLSFVGWQVFGIWPR
jgi:hypothetical protein